MSFLTIENQKLRKQVDILENELNAKDQLIETTSGKWKELATQMKKELLNLRTENAHIKDEMTKLIKASIEDKQNISQSLKREKELREQVNSRADEMAEMYKRSQEQITATFYFIKK